MGELSIKNMRPVAGIIWAVATAGCLIGAAVLIYLFLRGGFAGSLTPHDLDSLSTFLLLGVILGIAASVTTYLYGCYPAGTKCRLLFGLTSGALIVVYSFSVLIASGFPQVISGLGLKMDMIYPALVVAYASIILMFSFTGEYVSSREKWLKKVKTSEKGSVSA